MQSGQGKECNWNNPNRKAKETEGSLLRGIENISVGALRDRPAEFARGLRRNDGLAQGGLLERLDGAEDLLAEECSEHDSRKERGHTTQDA